MSDPIALLTRKNLPAPEHLEALAAAGLQPVVGSLADQDLPEDRVAVLMPALRSSCRDSSASIAPHWSGSRTWA